jgi:osmotically inducible lipoprotein OsmB
MKKIITSILATLLIMGSLTACTNRQMGTVGGAAIGGIAGSALTGGSAAGTVVGAVGGGIIGNQLSR